MVSVCVPTVGFYKETDDFFPWVVPIGCWFDCVDHAWISKQWKIWFNGLIVHSVWKHQPVLANLNFLSGRDCFGGHRGFESRFLTIQKSKQRCLRAWIGGENCMTKELLMECLLADPWTTNEPGQEFLRTGYAIPTAHPTDRGLICFPPSDLGPPQPPTTPSTPAPIVHPSQQSATSQLQPCGALRGPATSRTEPFGSSVFGRCRYRLVDIYIYIHIFIYMFVYLFVECVIYIYAYIYLFLWMKKIKM
jgi:hypothetical protein